MSRLLTMPAKLSRNPVWEIAELYPDQGAWSESEYLDLQTPRAVEFDNGHIEFLTMPTEQHQTIVLFLFSALQQFILPKKLGKALVAAIPVRVGSGKYREPDVLFMLAKNVRRRNNRYWDGADLVMEVVSGSAKDRKRDFKDKRRDYAAAGISEYWIVDPRNQTVTVLSLAGDAYQTFGMFSVGERASSSLLSGFGVDVKSVFANLS